MGSASHTCTGETPTSLHGLVRDASGRIFGRPDIDPLPEHPEGSVCGPCGRAHGPGEGASTCWW